MPFKTKLKPATGRIFKYLMSSSLFRKNIRLVLTYHRVVERLPLGLCDPALFVTANSLEMHINAIREMFDIVPLESIVQPNHGGKGLCSITFDDGWLDNYRSAFPILKKYHVPATVFLPVAMVGINHWFWFESLWNLAAQAGANDRGLDFVKWFQKNVPSWVSSGFAYKHLSNLTSVLKNFPADRLDQLLANAYTYLGIKPPERRIIMNWDEIMEMGISGISFGSHGLRHYILPTVDSSTKRKEIFDSFDILQKKGVPTVPFFSYPNGDWDNESIALVCEAGYRGALTIVRGYNTSRTNPFLLRRLIMHESISNSPSLFWSRIFQAVLAGSRSQSLQRYSMRSA